MPRAFVDTHEALAAHLEKDNMGLDDDEQPTVTRWSELPDPYAGWQRSSEIARGIGESLRVVVSRLFSATRGIGTDSINDGSESGCMLRLQPTRESLKLSLALRR